MLYWLTTLPGAYRGTGWNEIIVPNFMGSGYKIVAVATEFPGGGPYVPGEDTFWNIGSGPWTVNYQQVSTTFWPLALHYKPVAVLTFSRWTPTNEWLFEVVARNNVQALWNRALPLDFAGTPFKGGAPDDPAHAAGRPNANGGPVDGFPPDRNYPSWSGTDTGSNVRGLSPLSTQLVASATQAINGGSFGVFAKSGTTAGRPEENNNFVSAFVAYHAIWYQSAFQSRCQIGFHTHVGFNLTLAQCKRALCIQIRQAIALLGGITTGSCPPATPSSGSSGGEV